MPHSKRLAFTQMKLLLVIVALFAVSVFASEGTLKKKTKSRSRSNSVEQMSGPPNDSAHAAVPKDADIRLCPYFQKLTKEAKQKEIEEKGRK